MKTVVVKLQTSPYNSCRTAEGVRLALGLTAGDDQICLVLRGEAVRIATVHDPGRLELSWVGNLQEQLQLFKEMGGQVLVEREAVNEYAVGPLWAECQLADWGEIVPVLATADVVLNV